MSSISWLLTADGAAFTAIGIVVLAIPSPQPTLTTPVDAATLVPFKDTRRLLASQFLGNGLLALLVGTQVHDPALLQLAALARATTVLTVITVNVSQLRNGAWKPASLYGLITAFALLSVGYLTLAVTM